MKVEEHLKAVSHPPNSPNDNAEPSRSALIDSSRSVVGGVGPQQVSPLRRKLDSIQILRAVAAVLVVLTHLSKEMANRAPDVYRNWLVVPNWGGFGVDLFFVVSGFIMVYVTEHDVGRVGKSQKFFLKRLIRILPVYWIYTSLALAVAVSMPHLRIYGDSSIWYVLASYGFIPFERPSNGEVTPLYALGWTLNYEMYFYICFAFLMTRSRRTFGAAFVSFFVGAVLLGNAFEQSTLGLQLWYWSRPVILEFVAGALLAMFYLRGIKLPPLASFLLFAAGLIWWLVCSYYFPSPGLSARLFVWGVAATFLLASLVLTDRSVFDWLPRPVRRIGMTIGDSSYSLYLSHMFVVRVATMLVPSASPLGPAFLVIYPLLTVCVCLMVAYGSYRFLEVPIVRMGRRLVAPS